MTVMNGTTGYQHIGIPTNDMDKTTEFYHSLGFETAYATETDDGKVVFFRYQDIVIETYEVHGKAAGMRGAVDHVAFAVTDLEQTEKEIRALGYEIKEGPAFLPFWENGVKYFNIHGPNKEVIEFTQKL